MFIIAAIIAAAYLMGSVPSSVWLGKWIRGIDLREHGSGNAGATNAFRVLGKPLGIAVLLADMAKGYLAVLLSGFQEIFPEGTEGWMALRIGLGIAAVAGHIFPVFAGFRGGKGVATLAGIGLALYPVPALAALGVYLLIFLVSGISALGSLVAVISYPLWVILVFPSGFHTLSVFSILVLLLVLLTHRKNIVRLFRGEEGSVFRKKPPGDQ
jgi:acyl phosphate:glycerol-3-phosphate acyltransferase